MPSSTNASALSAVLTWRVRGTCERVHGRHQWGHVVAYREGVYLLWPRGTPSTDWWRDGDAGVHSLSSP